MDKFSLDLTSPYWWISVVVVGVLLNVMSGYLKAGLDQFVGSWFKKFKRSIEAEVSAREKLAAKLAASAEERQWHFQEETRTYFVCLRYTAMGLGVSAAGVAWILATKITSTTSVFQYIGFAILLAGFLTLYWAADMYEIARKHTAVSRRARELCLMSSSETGK